MQEQIEQQFWHCDPFQRAGQEMVLQLHRDLEQKPERMRTVKLHSTMQHITELH